ncbi:MAG: SigF/SigG family RNA polymerase sporulation sigma factor [Bacteroidales bacterium]|nr:SigF/SigG family RNA polymerase sporulation sigma factor [Clostridium sp.]MCM1204105.1 SigF/SigG family RNA polymerase sporulation sigma factor [Bacteroidales bacterium]
MDKTLELIRLAKEGNQDAKEQLVTDNLGLVWAVARRFIGRGHDLEDLYQIGCIGLIKCIDKFDLSYDVKFSTYAVPMISGEIKRFLRDDGLIKVSRTLKETAYKVKKAREEIINRTGIEPKLEELSEILEIDVEEIVASLEANVEVESIHKTIYQNDGNAVYLADKIADEKNENEKLLNHMVVEGLLSQLNEVEEKIIKLRYFESKTQTEIAKEVGISQVQVSRMEKKILLKMRESYK